MKLLPNLTLLVLAAVFSQAANACWLFCKASESDYAKTRYPMVLVHGMGAFDSILGINSFFQIPEDLRANGATVFVAQVSSFNSPEVRGEQLLQQVQQYLALSGAEKVNLIGHSHGSITSRYVAAVAPELVASVTSIGGPVTGAPLADTINSLRDIPLLGPVLEAVIVPIVNFSGKLIAFISEGGNLPQDALAALNSVTTTGAAHLNLRYPGGVPDTACGEGEPVHNGIYYYSWSGSKTITNLFDPFDTLLLVVAPTLKGEPGDGLVGACSSHLGQVIRDDYRMNHFDEVNHLLGLVSLRETNPKAVWRQHANRLQRAGL